jgi:hypothetical protein
MRAPYSSQEKERISALSLRQLDGARAAELANPRHDCGTVHIG